MATRDLLAHLADKEAQLARAQREVDLLATEVRTLRHAMRLLGVNVPESPPGASLTETTVAQKPKVRGPKGNWRRLMIAALPRLMDEFGFDDLLNVATSIGIDIPRSSARSQVNNYVSYGWFERISDGRFKFTDLGRQKVSELRSDEPERDSAVQDGLPPAPEQDPELFQQKGEEGQEGP